MGRCDDLITTIRAAFAASGYPLRKSSILDSGATIYIFNEICRFLGYRPARSDDFLIAGEHEVLIQGYGQVNITTKGPKGPRIITLFDVAYCPDFPCNLVSLRRLQRQGYWWDTRPEFNCLRTSDHLIKCFLSDQYDQFVLEYVPCDAAFPVRPNRFNSSTRPKATKQDARRWHLRLGHPGPQALERLVNKVTGARIKGITTVECDDCGTSKMTRQVSRLLRDLPAGPCLRLAIDFHDLEEDPEERASLLLITDRYSGYIWDYYLKTRKHTELVAVFKDFLGHLFRQYQLKPRVIECDREILGKSEDRPRLVYRLFTGMSIIVESTAADTAAQNGGAELSGKVIKIKARALRAGARFPSYLWVEIYRAAVYLYNRTPRGVNNWDTPYARFHTAIAQRDGHGQENKVPYLGHLRVYGSKAFALTQDALKGRNKRQRLNPRAWIGYLVGYQSTNIYRIWNPATGKVISTRDVIFNEDDQFNGNLNQLQDDLLHISKEELDQLLNQAEEVQLDQLPEETAGRLTSRWDQTHYEDQGLIYDEDQVDDIIPIPDVEGLENRDIGMILSEARSDQPAGTVVHSSDRVTEDSQGNLEKGNDALEGSHSDTLSSYDRAYLTPVSLLPTALLAMTIQDASDPPGKLDPRDPRVSRVERSDIWKAAFNAGRLASPIGTLDGKVIDKAKLQRLLKKPRSVHQSQLPKLPRHHRDLRDHPMGVQFEQAERDHLRSHREMESWIEIDLDDQRTLGKQTLDCMWVYVYKLDKHGRFIKCKARLVVRGDQQPKGLDEETYAATLAGRSFRTLIAIAARFDLDLIQYDAVNAFVNAKLDRHILMKMPPGYRSPGKILLIQKALYGLRESPLLWQKELTATLQDLGFKPVRHEPCCMTKNGIIVFYYVDDIVFACRKDKRQDVQRAVADLKAHYDLTGGQDLQWFLGIEVIRDRKKRLIWLSQSSYLAKIANLVDDLDQRHETPMKKEALQPFDQRASIPSIRRYQRKVGSILYAVVMTRPDTAFAISRLARFNSNPGPEHHRAADRALLYLLKTSSLALQFGQDDHFLVASDASYADNPDRKSSQAYVMRLFGGTIGWRANKQATVTTSTTEAELLALSQAAREAMFISRLVKELGIQLEEERIHIQCDNQQTIQLIHKEINKLQTKLRHVDIHNHWLRQEAQRNRIQVDYINTKEMIADGLTKAVSNPAFQRSVEQLGLVDISDRLEQRKLKELMEEDLEI